MNDPTRYKQLEDGTYVVPYTHPRWGAEQHLFSPSLVHRITRVPKYYWEYTTYDNATKAFEVWIGACRHGPKEPPEHTCRESYENFERRRKERDRIENAERAKRIEDEYQKDLANAKSTIQSMTQADAWKLIRGNLSCYYNYYANEVGPFGYDPDRPDPDNLLESHAINLLNQHFKTPD